MRSQVIIVILVVCGAALGQKPDDGDDNKPYKFGFNIEKYQHRLEEKDSKGIVKGEYGFVTGDGVYHETAYATDENGDFKILGMRNYFVGLPGQNLPDITKGAAQSTTSTSTTTPPAPKAESNVASILKGLMGCGSCTIPEPNQAAPATNLSPPESSSGSAGNTGAFGRPLSSFGASPSVSSPGSPSPPSLSSVPSPGSPGSSSIASPAPPSPGLNYPDNVPTPSTAPGTGGGSNTSKDQVGGALTAVDVLKLLYRFNYTVGFHGHHEQGDGEGRKHGGYFVNGRDGVGRAVSYDANEFGFQPNITLVQLGAEDTPREDTERGDDHGLRGYEFVWYNHQR